MKAPVFKQSPKQSRSNMGSFSLPLVLVAIAVVIGGCSSAERRDDGTQSRATVEDRSGAATAGTGADDDSGATASGLDDDQTMSAARLDDPDGPLSVRVIYFDYDSATIRADFTDTIAAHANYLAANPGASVTLEGHADERGTREYNLALGERRALAVRRQLVLLGAAAGQINAVSYGEERPAMDGHDDESYSLNRRVELVY